MFRPRLFFVHRPRNGFLRVLGSLLGAALLIGILAFGFVALLALLAVGGVIWLVRQLQQPVATPTAASPPPPPPPAGVIEGEFTVVRDNSRVPQA
jgi:hypothetical protein